MVPAESSEDDGFRRHNHDAIKGEAWRGSDLLNLINEIATCRISTRVMDMRPGRLTASEGDGFCQLFLALAADKRLNLAIAVDAEPPRTIDADPQVITIQNLACRP
jgi:hypothetical protein